GSAVVAYLHLEPRERSPASAVAKATGVKGNQPFRRHIVKTETKDRHLTPATRARTHGARVPGFVAPNRWGHSLARAAALVTHRLLSVWRMRAPSPSAARGCPTPSDLSLGPHRNTGRPSRHAGRVLEPDEDAVQVNQDVPCFCFALLIKGAGRDTGSPAR